MGKVARDDQKLPHHGITRQRLVHIFYGGVSSHNRTRLDVACGGNIMLYPFVDVIKIIEDVCFNPYNNSRGMRIMKRSINQVEIDES